MKFLFLKLLGATSRENLGWDINGRGKERGRVGREEGQGERAGRDRARRDRVGRGGKGLEGGWKGGRGEGGRKESRIIVFVFFC